MIKKHLFLLVCFIAVIVLVPDWAAAENPQIAELHKIVKQKTELIDVWDSNAQKLFLLTVVVFALGIISGSLSAVKAPWAKIGIGIAGGAVAIITAVINLGYNVDYKTYKKKTAEARIKIDEIQMQISWLSCIDDSNKLKELIDANIMPKLKEIHEIGIQLTARNDLPKFGISEAYAQEKLPEWLTKAPQDKHTLYFVGHGIASDPKTAESAALVYTKDTAKVSIVDALVDSGIKNDDPSHRRIVQNVLEGAEFINHFVKYDPRKKVYRHFALMKIDIDTIQIRLQLLAARSNTVVPDKFIDSLKKIAMP